MTTPSYDDVLMSISDQLRTLKQNGATEDELNTYAKNSLNKARYDLDGYIDGLLNSKEQALYDSNVANGLLCMGNGKFATDYAEDNYSSGLHNGNGDAFRHTIWNFGMVIDVGYDFAKKWSTAHEDGGTGPALEKQMDLFNNLVGLTLGKDNPGTILHSTFISKTKEKVSNGSCRIIANNKLVNSNKDGLK